MLRKLDQAEESYQKAVTLEPKYVMAYQNLANVLRDRGRTDDAIVCLQKILAIAPDLASTRHDLAALLGNTTENAPKEYVKDLFDQFANQFEDHLQDKLQYKIPAFIKGVMTDKGLCENSYETVVDLGCGTGLSGVEFKDVARTLIGIDLSQKMIQKAHNKGVYDQLEVDDLIGGLQKIRPQIDLFIATDVFVYVGKLEETFEAIRQKATPKALFIFSTEHTDTIDTYVLQDTSRYAHSKTYIENLADDFGFEVHHFETTNLRKDKDGWIPGGVYVLKLK